MKTCSRCGCEKPLEDFYTAGRRKDGSLIPMTICKPCSAIKSREYREAHLDANRAQKRQKMREYREQDPEGVRRRQYSRRLKSKYGITIEDYDRMFNEQDGQCAICGTTTPGWPSLFGTFCVDHDARTGAVRGLLCSTCNQGLGYFIDSPTLLEAAAGYLRHALEAGKEVKAEHGHRL